MKVDIQRMDDAYIRLMGVHQKLLSIEADVQTVMQRLACQNLGNVSENAIINALNNQIRVLEHRQEGIRQLAQTLESVSERYRQCEERLEVQAQNEASLIYGRISDDDIRRLMLIQPIKEKEVIDRYIRPLIAEVERGTT